MTHFKTGGARMLMSISYKYEVSALSLAGESDRSAAMVSPTSPFQVSGVVSDAQTTGSIDGRQRASDY